MSRDCKHRHVHCSLLSQACFEEHRHAQLSFTMPDLAANGRLHFTKHLRLRSCSRAHALNIIIENTTWHASHSPLSKCSQEDDGMFLKCLPTFKVSYIRAPSRHLMQQYYTIPCATLCTYPVYAPSEISPFHVLSVRPRVSIRFCHLGPPLSFFLK